MDRPAACMAHLYSWLGVSAVAIDADRISIGAQERDSHYHMKYPHRQSARIVKPDRHEVSPRIQAQIETACPWYYQRYYPNKS